MLKYMISRKIQLTAIIITMVVLLGLTAAFAVTKLIQADKGGEIEMAEGVKLTIPPGALFEDTEISADMGLIDGYILYVFEPSPMNVSSPLKLSLTWQAIVDLELMDLILHGPYGELIEPVPTDDGLEWPIPHFSTYYHRRR